MAKQCLRQHAWGIISESIRPGEAELQTSQVLPTSANSTMLISGPQVDAMLPTLNFSVYSWELRAPQGIVEQTCQFVLMAAI